VLFGRLVVGPFLFSYKNAFIGSILKKLSGAFSKLFFKENKRAFISQDNERVIIKKDVKRSNRKRHF
jgi:hypothetical protein